jgi:sugar phosphate isomerase/epimerase
VTDAYVLGVTNAISFMTANYVAEHTGWAMRDWGHGDRATNDHFRAPATFAERFDELLQRVRGLGFDTIDLWGAHLSPEWATQEHLAAARDLLGEHRLRVASYAVFVEKDAARIERTCDIAGALGTRLLAGMTSAPRGVLLPILRERGVRLGLENHRERNPRELLEQIGDDADVLGATVDTGWFATQGYDPPRALEELAPHVLAVHLKDVLEAGEHETCRWGEGVVPVEACVRVLQRTGYRGALTVEHEPEHFDPSEHVRAMRAQLEEWLA